MLRGLRYPVLQETMCLRLRELREAGMFRFDERGLRVGSIEIH